MLLEVAFGRPLGITFADLAWRWCLLEVLRAGWENLSRGAAASKLFRDKVKICALDPP